MSNTYSSSLVTQKLEEVALTTLQNKFAPLRAFSRQFSTDSYKPKATVQVKLVTAGSNTLTDASNFESGDSVVSNVPVVVHQYTQPFQVSNADLNSGLRVQDLVEANAKTFANTIMDIALAPVTTANFGAATCVTSAALFSFNELTLLYGALKKSDTKNLILDPTYFARIVNNPAFFQPAGTKPGDGWKPFGWDFIGETSRWNGAGPNIQGFACHPQAIAVAAGVPAVPPNAGNVLERKEVTLEGLELTVVFHVWFSLATRTLWASYDAMFGAAPADTTAGFIVASQ